MSDQGSDDDQRRDKLLLRLLNAPPSRASNGSAARGSRRVLGLMANAPASEIRTTGFRMTPDPGVSVASAASQGQPMPVRFVPSQLPLFRAELARAQDTLQVRHLASRLVQRWREALTAFPEGQGR